MTKQRAIELLNEFHLCCDFEHCTNAWDCDECVEALNMAIKALEQLSLPKIIVSQGERSQNCVKCKHYCETEDDTGVHSQCRLESDTDGSD